MIKTKYKATVQKGYGEDFFEWEVHLAAWNIAEAAADVHARVKDSDGWVTAIEQDDDLAIDNLT